MPRERLSAQAARQGSKGRPVLIVLAVSTVAAAAALLGYAFFMDRQDVSEPVPQSQQAPQEPSPQEPSPQEPSPAPQAQ